MKQKDILLIAVVIIVSGIISIFASRFLFSGEKGKLEAETVQAISAEFPELNKKYFNQNSINPVRLITIGKSDNTQPFNSAQQPE